MSAPAAPAAPAAPPPGPATASRPPAGKAPGTGSALLHPTVARLTYRALLGRRRALLLCALPALLLLISGAVRALAGADDGNTSDLLQGFALSVMVPLVGVIAGTGAIGPEIDDGAIVYLLAKPVKRSTIVLTKLLVAIGVTAAFSAIPVLAAGFVLNGNGRQLAVAYAVGAAVASVAYAAVFLMLGVITRHAVIAGLVYALVWETVIGNVVPGARTLSVQQWAAAVARKIGEGDLVTSDVSLPTAVVLLTLTTVTTTWYAIRRLRALTLSGEE
jgi:ABC-2 type transport system permease protein